MPGPNQRVGGEDSRHLREVAAVPGLPRMGVYCLYAETTGAALEPVGGHALGRLDPDFQTRDSSSCPKEAGHPRWLPVQEPKPTL